ncbi:alpha/beta hydrolase [uncultured Ruegeria sp.]|uniref:alpha/beta fold hydrolase n=1 Tax=uncultured Ruegeria sp. TaxID=259304 RepID=UPI002634B575|nr:alpha/beta hydrolase [uncultured Ruegeria sp.]
MEERPATSNLSTEKEILVLLHGGAMSANSLRPIAERLPNFRCLTPDIRGHGRNRDVPFSGIGLCADEIVSLLQREARGPVHLFGLSLGGYVAMQMLADRKVPVRTAIVSGVTFREPRMTCALNALVDVTYPLLGIERLRGLAGRLAGIEDAGLMSDPDGGAWAHPKTVRDLAQAVLRTNAQDLAATNPVRSLYLAGSREPNAVTRSLAEIEPHFPNAHVGIVEDGRHGWCLNAPDLAARIIEDWISNRPLPSEVTPLKPGPDYR